MRPSSILFLAPLAAALPAAIQPSDLSVTPLTAEEIQSLAVDLPYHIPFASSSDVNLAKRHTPLSPPSADNDAAAPQPPPQPQTQMQTPLSNTAKGRKWGAGLLDSWVASLTGGKEGKCVMLVDVD